MGSSPRSDRKTCPAKGDTMTRRADGDRAVATAKTKFRETCRARLISQRRSQPALPRWRDARCFARSSIRGKGADESRQRAVARRRRLLHQVNERCRQPRRRYPGANAAGIPACARTAPSLRAESAYASGVACRTDCRGRQGALSARNPRLPTRPNRATAIGEQVSVEADGAGGSRLNGSRRHVRRWHDVGQSG
jgi:hypothetical protein